MTRRQFKSRIKKLKKKLPKMNRAMKRQAKVYAIAAFTVVLTGSMFFSAPQSGFSSQGIQAAGIASPGLQEKFFTQVRFLEENQGMFGLTPTQNYNLNRLTETMRAKVQRNGEQLTKVNRAIARRLDGVQINPGVYTDLVQRKQDIEMLESYDLAQAYQDMIYVLSDTQYELLKQLNQGK